VHSTFLFLSICAGAQLDTVFHRKILSSVGVTPATKGLAMSVSVSDYFALLDGNHLLETERIRSKFFRFKLENDFIADKEWKFPVLTFRVKVPGKDTRLHVHVNPELTQSSSDGFPAPNFVCKLSNGYLGQMISVLPGARFKKNEENTIAFTISGDGNKFGNIEIGDAVLFYQRLVS
jgi:hypothetical protein